jgi:hypothetical protein
MRDALRTVARPAGRYAAMFSLQAGRFNEPSDEPEANGVGLHDA